MWTRHDPIEGPVIQVGFPKKPKKRVGSPAVNANVFSDSAYAELNLFFLQVAIAINMKYFTEF